MAKEKFTRHQVVGRVGYGVGVQLALTPTQIHDRLHALVVDDEKLGIVTVTEPIEFRPGEIIGIAHDLSRYEAESLEVFEKQGKKEKPPTAQTVPTTNPPPPADPGQNVSGLPDPNTPSSTDPDQKAGDGDAGGK